jgi:hypothetical protein
LLFFCLTAAKKKFRGTTIAKKLFAHAKRNRGVDPIPEPKPGTFILPTDGMLPSEQRWEELIANREMTRREVQKRKGTALRVGLTLYTGVPAVLERRDGDVHAAAWQMCHH